MSNSPRKERKKNNDGREGSVTAVVADGARVVGRCEWTIVLPFWEKEIYHCIVFVDVSFPPSRLPVLKAVFAFMSP